MKNKKWEDRDRKNSLTIYNSLELININYICNDLYKTRTLRFKHTHTHTYIHTHKGTVALETLQSYLGVYYVALTLVIVH